MYFGSVRFFKHLIIALLLLAIIIPVAIAIKLELDNRQKTLQIEQLESSNTTLSQILGQYNGKDPLTAEETYALLQRIGVDKEALIRYMYEQDKDAFSVIADKPAVTTAPGSKTPEPTSAEEPTSPYLHLYPDLYANVAVTEYIEDDNTIYLTFDDGPSKYTNDILAYLERYQIQATFFVVPDNTEECKTYLNRIIDAGHALGVHTYTHVYEDIYASVEAYLEDFNKAYELIYAHTGYKPFLFRFPGGSKNDFNQDIYPDIISEMTRRGFVYFDWNVDSEDAYNSSWTTMYNNVIEGIRSKGENRSVVLFHDGPDRKNTVLVLEDVIVALKGFGQYTFSPITEKTRPMQF